MIAGKDNQVEEHEQAAHAPLWPTITSACRPWTRWWWMGSAVDEAEITRQLQLFQAAGIGGVESGPAASARGPMAGRVHRGWPHAAQADGHRTSDKLDRVAR